MQVLTPSRPADRPSSHPSHTPPASVTNEEVRIPCGSARMQGDLMLPRQALGLVLFAHGSGSGRHSARNRQVAQALQQAGMATLLLDLLTAEEEQADLHTREHRFNIALLTERLQAATQWAQAQENLQSLPLGYFGASTGSAAALIAAARLGRRIAAVVSRGGRPDLVGAVALASLKAPTLLIVGGADHSVLDLNEQACQHLRCDRRLAVVPGAGHLFEEPGALEQVAALATTWFSLHLRQRASSLEGAAS